MKKRILALLGLTSVALVASVISLSTSNEAPLKETEQVFAADDPNTNWGGMKAIPFGDRYETTWTSEPKYSTQSPLQFSTMDIGDVWKNYQGFESGDKPVKVAVIDSGIDIYHEDFLKPDAKNVSITASNVNTYSILDPNSCYIHDTSNGYNSKSVVTEVGIDKAYDTDTYDSNYKEYYSHGTASAACIGAAINGAGGLGIAPKCELLIIRMDFYFTSLDTAIRYAADHGANVINMSLGAYAETFTDGYGDEQSGSSSVASALTSAINYALSKDCVVVAAAGNEKTNHKSYPACNAGVIGVGALASKSKTGAADFSNYNLDSDTSSTNNNVDVMAPGYVYTANMDASNGPKTGSNLKDTSYQNTQGTSFASPLTAGAIALARSKYPDMTHTEIEQRLFSTCSDIGNTGWDKKFGYGRVNISNLIGVTYEVEDITLNKTSINLYNNSTTTTLVADVLPETATNRLIHWSSSNTSVVTVPATSNAGAEITVTPKGVGTATITARSDFDNTILKQCSVTVSSYVSSEFTLSAPKTTIMEGETVQTSVAFTHENPTSTEILYDTSNSSVATVSDSGLVTGVGAGTATITAVSADDIQEITITVTLDPTKDSATIEFGDWPSGGTSGSGSALSVTKSIFSMSLDKGYNSGSEIRNYANGTVTVSITNGTILSFSITLAGKDGGSLSVQSGGGSISRNSNVVNYTSGSTPSSSVKFKNGDQMRFTDTTIVYKSNIDPTVQYTVTFNGNGGSTPTSQTVASGTIITLPSSTRTDYTFLGWSTSSSATSATYNGGASYTVESNITLYAVWSSSGGGGGGGEITDLETTTYGFTDKNWSDSTSSWKSNSAGFGYDASRGIQRTAGTCEGETKNSISNITKISIKAVTTGSGVGTYSIYVGATLVGSLPLSKDTTLKDYEVYSGTPITGKVKININCTTNSLYIKSATITTGTSGGGGGGDTPATNYTVSFNANGGSGNMSSATTTGSSYIVPACTFTRTDYTFSKWALNSASGTQYSVGSTITGITGNITLYAVWRSGSSGGVQMDPHYYDSITSDLTGTDLLSALRTLNLKKRTSTVGYSSMGTSPSGQFKYTDYDPTTVQYNSDGQPYGTKILSFYSGQSTTSFNREHVWPNSRGGGSVDSDIYMPRPTNQAENSNRGNSSYVEGMCHSANGWDPVTAFDSTLGTYSNIRGECARIIFYCTTANGSLSIKEGADLSYSNSIGNLSDLLKWNLQYPVNDREIRRQSGGQYLQGNRNAFVDDPNYACKIWGNTNAETKSICGITDKNLSSITLGGNYKTQFEVGDNFSFGGTVTANYSNSSPADVTSKATYSGYDLSTAGNQTVTVSYTENNVTKTATYNITVTDSTPKVTGISLDKYSLQLDVIGTVTETLTATVTGDAGADKTVSWSSSDTSVATVSASTGNTITVTGHKVGTATITASAGEHSITCSVSVIDSTPVVHSVTITSMPEKLDVTSNPTGEITLSIDADSGADASVTWDSSNKSVATVAPIVKSAKRSTGGIEVSATITAVGVGTTIISAEAGGKSASYELTIEDSTPHANGVTLDQTSVTLNIGDNITLTPTVSPSDAIDKQVTWESSTTSVATVDSSGVVRAVSVGSTTITVTTVDGGHTATCSVTVRSSSATVVRYELSPENSSVPYMTGKGSTTVNFTLYAIYSDNTRSPVEDSISKSITTSSLGEKSVNYTYNGTKYTSSVKVTNNGASIGADSSFNATPAQQAEAWANYFINMTRTEDTCLANSDEDKLAGLQAVWSELSAEYGYMIANSKTAFCSSSASAKIKEALQHYQYIISKFNKDGVELTDFVVDGNNQKPASSSSKSLMSTMFSFENSGFIVAILSIIGVASIAVFVVYKRRKIY